MDDYPEEPSTKQQIYDALRRIEEEVSDLHASLEFWINQLEDDLDD